MNERIEAYLKQHYCRDYFNRYGEMVEDDYYFMYREEVDGLIELIVRECANICDNFQARNVGMQPSECAGAIRHRFGVKG